MSKHLLLRYVSWALKQVPGGDAYIIMDGDSDGHTSIVPLLKRYDDGKIVRDDVALIHGATRSRLEDARRWTIVRRGRARRTLGAALRRDAKRRIARNAGGGGDAVRMELVVSRWARPHNPRRLGGTAEAVKRHQLSSAPTVTPLQSSRNRSSSDDVALYIASLLTTPQRTSCRNRLHGVDRSNRRFGARLFLECARGGAHA